LACNWGRESARAASRPATSRWDITGKKLGRHNFRKIVLWLESPKSLPQEHRSGVKSCERKQDRSFPAGQRKLLGGGGRVGLKRKRAPGVEGSKGYSEFLRKTRTKRRKR